MEGNDNLDDLLQELSLEEEDQFYLHQEPPWFFSGVTLRDMLITVN